MFSRQGVSGISKGVRKNGVKNCKIHEDENMNGSLVLLEGIKVTYL